MGLYILRRLLLAIPTLVGITLVTFAISRLAPGDPVAIDIEGAPGGALSSESIDAFRQRHGLDQPLPAQYLTWVKRMATLDFGVSTRDHRRVSEKIAEALPRTFLLTALAMVFAYLVAVPLGVVCAARRGSWFDRLVTTTLFVLYALPPFWVAVMLVLAFASEHGLGLFPLQGLRSAAFDSYGPFEKLADLAWHAVLPVACLSYPMLIVATRYMRAGMIDVAGQDFVRTARAKGLSERVVLLRHMLRNGALPALTALGLSLPYLVGGSVIVEQVFGIPGMGRLAYDAVFSRDHPTTMGVTTIMAVVTLISLLLTDLLYAWVDPRLRLGASSR